MGRQERKAARARFRADRDAYRAAVNAAARAKPSTSRASGFTFYDDGTVDYSPAGAASLGGMLAKAKPRSELIDVVYSDSRMNKPTVGRAIGAVASGGLNLLFSGRTGGTVVTIITVDWTQQSASTADQTRLYGMARAALARRDQA